MTITVSTNDPRSVKALALLEGAAQWTRAHRKADGRSFFVIPGARERVYWTDQTSCTCPDAAHRGVTCKHQVAVRLWNARHHERAQQPRRPRLEERESWQERDAREERLERPRLDPARVAELSAEYTSLFSEEG